MKILKRSVSVFLAALMILSSMSAFATLNDGQKRTLTSQVRFYRCVDEDNDVWEETTRVAPGERIQARIILQSDFVVGGHFLFYLFNKDVFEVDTDAEKGTLNSLVDTRSGDANWTGDGTGFTEAEINTMIRDGYLDSSITDEYDVFYVQADSGISSILDGETELYAVNFIVKDDAPLDEVATMFVPVETRRQLRSIDNNYSHLYTYAARAVEETDIGLDVNSIDVKNVQDWDNNFELYNLASVNTSTVASSQGFTSEEAEANTEFTYNIDKTVTSSFVTVSNQINVNYYIPASFYDEEDDESAAVWKEAYEYTSGTGSKKKTYYDQTYPDMATVFEGMAPTVPGTYGVIQDIPEGYYFAGWAPIDPEDYTFSTSNLSTYNSKLAAISDTAVGEGYDYSAVDGTKNGGDPETIESIIADPNAAKLKPVTSELFGSFIYEDEDGYDTLDVVAVLLEIPTEDVTVTFNATEKPDGSTATEETSVDIAPGEEMAAADVPAAPAVEGYTFNWYTDEDCTEGHEFTFPATINSDTELWGKYTKNTYKLYKVVDGGEPEEVASYKYGDTIDTVADLTLLGHTFSGWKKDSSLEEAYDFGTAMPAYNVTIYGAFTINKYVITFVDEDGTPLQTLENVPYGTTPVYTEDEPTKAATDEYTFTFDGWTPDIVAATEETTYTATYKSTPVSYTLTFKDYDGSQIGDSKDVAFGGEINAPDYPEKDGVQYTGWVDSEGNTPADYEDGMPAKNLEFTAVASFAVKYIVDGVQVGTTQYVSADAAVPTFDGEDPEKEHFTFTGWKDASDKAPADYEKMPSKPLTFVAQFEADKTFIFDPDGGQWTDGTTGSKTITVPYDKEFEDAVAELADEPTITGAEFDGWTEEDGIYVPDWKPIEYKITFHADETGEIPYEVVGDLYYGDEIEYPDDPDYEGHDFMGWFTKVNGEGDQYDEGDGKTMPAEDLDLYAYFTATEYTITFQNEDGTELQRGKVAYGETPVYTGDTPTKEATAEYTYSWNAEDGWTEAIETVTGNKTYTAKFTATKNKYTAKFVNYDGSTLAIVPDVEYGTEPVYSGDTPTKPSAGGKDYVFTGWSPNPKEGIKGDTTYTAQFREEGQTFTITFVDEDGTELQSGSVAYGEMPEYEGDTPTKAATAEYTYSWDEADGWTETVVAATADKTYTAKFTAVPNPYKLYKVVDGGEPEEVATYNYGETIQTVANLTRAGYEFSGWKTNNTLETAYTFGGTMPAVDVTIYGAFTAQSQTITYVIDGVEQTEGTYAPNNTFVTDAEFTLENEPILAGYEYSKWTLESGDPVPETMPAGGIKVVTSKEAQPQTITYVIDSVEQTEGDYAPETCLTGEEFILLLEPEKAGYSYSAWAVKDADDNAYTGKTMPAGGIKVYTTSTAQPQTITYYIDGVEQTEGTYAPDSTFVTDEEFALADEPERAGYSYSDWAVEDANGNAYTGKTMPAGGINAYTTSTAQPQTITYVIDGIEQTEGTYAPDSTFVTDEEFALADEPERAGYSYSDWAVEDANGNAYTGKTMPAGGIKVVSNGTALPQTITYYIDGVEQTEGDYAPDNTFVTDAEFTLADLPEDEGTSYSNWVVKDKDDEVYTGKTMPAGGIKAYTTSNAIPQTITFVGEDGVTLYSTTVPYGETPVYAGETPTKAATAEYSYSWDAADGWTPAIVPATENTTYTVKFKAEARAYKVNYIIDGEKYDTLSFIYGTEINLDYAPVADGYEFDGWYDNVDCTGEKLSAPYTMPAMNIDIFAKTTGKEITINIVDEEDKPICEPITVNVGDVIPELATPTKTGYKFVGWESDTDNVVPGATMPPLADGSTVTFTGIFEAGEYNVVYKDEAGNEVETFKVAFGDEIEVPADPEKDGVQYITWKDSEGKEPTDYTDGMPAEDLEFTAVVAYEVKYIVDDAQVGTSQFAEPDAAVPAFNGESDPEKEHFTFTGWKDASDKAPADYEKMPNKPLTFYAQFEADKTYIFNPDGGQWTDGTTGSKKITVPYDEDLDDAVTKLADEPTMTGAEFDGWTEEDGVYVPDWKPIEYKITFHADETGEIPYEVVGDLYYDDEIEYPDDPDYEGHDFIGWFTKVNGEGDQYDEGDGKTMPAEDLDLYAYFTVKDYTITFKNEDGTVLQSGSVAYGDMPEYKGATPTKEATDEYSYSWDAEDGWTEAIAAVTGNKTYIAKFTPIPKEYVLTFKDYDGSQIGDSKDVAFGGEINAPDYEAGEGVQFIGWVDSEGNAPADYTDGMPAKDLEFTAVVSFAVKYVVDGVQVGTTQYAKAGEAVPAFSGEEPVKENFTFTGWKDADENAPADYTEMPDKPLTFVAQFAADKSFTFDPVDGKWSDDSTEPKTVTVPYDEDLDDAIAKLADEPTKDGATFDSWTEKDGTYVPVWKARSYIVTFVNEDGTELQSSEWEYNTTPVYSGKTPEKAADAQYTYEFADWTPAIVPVTEATVYTATFTAIPIPAAIVKLVPKDADSTALVERDGVVETNVTIAEADYPYGVTSVIAPFSDTYGSYSSTDYAKWYVTGIPVNTKEADLANYVTVTGGGYYELENTFGNGRVGTGNVIVVKDADGQIVEKFTVVIYGDLDGNGVITNDDKVMAKSEINSRVWSSSTGKIDYMVKAADLDQNGRYSNDDRVELEKYLNNKATYNVEQTLGYVDKI